MTGLLRRVLVGPVRSARQRYIALGLVAGLFGVTFLGYAVDVFSISGGVVFLPGEAAAVGSLGAAYLGYQRDGLVLAWLGMYAALLGYSADHYLLGLSGRSVPERIDAFLGLDGLVVLGVEAVVLGTLAFLVGICCHRGVTIAREATMDTIRR